jgi:hypothetical protein
MPACQARGQRRALAKRWGNQVEEAGKRTPPRCGADERAGRSRIPPTAAPARVCQVVGGLLPIEDAVLARHLPAAQLAQLRQHVSDPARAFLIGLQFGRGLLVVAGLGLEEAVERCFCRSHDGIGLVCVTPPRVGEKLLPSHYFWPSFALMQSHAPFSGPASCVPNVGREAIAR